MTTLYGWEWFVKLCWAYGIRIMSRCIQLSRGVMGTILNISWSLGVMASTIQWRRHYGEEERLKGIIYGKAQWIIGLSHGNSSSTMLLRNSTMNSFIMWSWDRHLTPWDSQSRFSKPESTKEPEGSPKSPQQALGLLEATGSWWYVERLLCYVQRGLTQKV